MGETTKSDARSSLDTEWKRLKHLIPEITGDPGLADAIERDILNIINGKSTCEDIVKSQKILSKDGIILILLKLEKDRIVSCVEPIEKLREVKFEKREAEKEQEFMLLEKKRALNRISIKEEEILDQKAQNKKLRKEIASIKEKIELANENVETINKNHKEAMNSVDLLVSIKMDMIKRNKNVNEAVSLIKEEVVFLKDEKWSAMRSIKELENKIEKMLHYQETITPKMSVYRSVVREAYKTLRDAQNRADYALRNIEN